MDFCMAEIVSEGVSESEQKVHDWGLGSEISSVGQIWTNVGLI